MSMQNSIPTKPAKPTRKDWISYVLLIITWGSGFAFSKVAVSEIAPSVLIAGRVWIGAALLYAWVRFRGHQLPPLFPRPDIRWAWFVLVGASGAAIPFFLNAWAMQSLDSGLTAIILATMPLGTAFLTHYTIPGDQMTRYKISGLVLGIVGIILLVGPGALQDIGAVHSLAQLAVLTAAMLYAINAVLIHFMPETPPSVAATGMMITSGIMVLPFAVIDGWHSQIPSFAAMFSVFALGVGATGFATILYMQTIRSAGPSFLATANYFVPPFAVFVGAIFLGEVPSVLAMIALCVILLGLYFERKNLS